MTITTRLIRAALLTAVTVPLAWAGAASAQGQNTQPAEQQGQTSAPATEVSDQDLETYVDATVKLQQVNDKWQQRYQQTADDRERVDLQQQAQAEMVETVEKEGLSVGQYNSISQAVQSDPELQAKAMAFMQEKMQQRGG